MTGQHLRYLYLMDFRGITVLLSLVSFISMCFIAFLQTRDAFIAGRRGHGIQVEAYYVCFSCVFFIVVLFMPVLNGNYVSWAMLRYNIYVFYLALFNYAYIFHFIFYRKRRVRAVIPLAATGITIIMAVYTLHYANRADIGGGLSAMLDYYPDYVECIDELAVSSGLQYGVAGYWYAKTTTMFSRKNVRLYAIYNDMAIMYHVSNRNWYYKSGKGAHANPDFKFVVLNSIDTSSITNFLGEPLKVFSCKKDMKILEFPEFEFDPVKRRIFTPARAEK
jgi:hypothetical protein